MHRVPTLIRAANSYNTPKIMTSISGNHEQLFGQPVMVREAVLVHEPLPHGLDRQLGYFGHARYCLFYFEPRAESAVWNDGRSYGFGPGSWLPFSDWVEPLAHRCGVTLGSRRSGGNVLVIDRQDRSAYFVAWRVAEQLIIAQHRTAALQAVAA
jgi:hypothetical protein